MRSAEPAGRTRQDAERAAAAALVERRSARLFAFMAFWFEQFFRRHMNGLRLAQWGQPDECARARPLIVYSNHPAWWDAVVYILLGRRLFPDLVAFAPIDAAMLARYGVFGRIGGFAVELDTRQGARSFRRVAAAVLTGPDRSLWLTAQGRFADIRARPLALRPGVAHLAAVAPDAVFMPLAIDYAFWTERGAEALVAFGAPLTAAELLAQPRSTRLARLEAALAATMDRLAVDAMARDGARFVTLVEGRPGIGGIYDLWRRLRALLAGRRFDPAHAERARFERGQPGHEPFSR